MWVSDPDSGDNKDRRDVNRHEMDLPLALYDRNRELLDEEPQLKNISLRGLGFVTIQQMQAGEEFRFRLGLSGRGILSGTARICWINPSSTGLQFHCGAEIRSLGWNDRSKLRKFLHPSAPTMSSLVDGLLISACLGVLYLLVKDSALLQGQTFNVFLENTTNWLPAVLLAVALGVILTFYSKR